MGFGVTNYGEPRLRNVVGPADERARKVYVEYVRKVKKLGRPGVAGDEDRFVQRLLELTGMTIGLVLGYFGEASSSMHQLVAKCAEGIAEANWEEMGFKRRLYGEWGVASQREIARIRLGGLRWLGRCAYYPAGAVHAASDARQDAREHARLGLLAGDLAPAFKKADSKEASSGYWGWVGDVERHEMAQKRATPKFRLSKDDQAVASLDEDYLLECMRQDFASTDAAAAARRNDEAPRKRDATPAPDPICRSLCGDIFQRQEDAKFQQRRNKMGAYEEEPADRRETFRRDAMRNVTPVVHAKPFRPTKQLASATHSEGVEHFAGGWGGVYSYNDAKRGYYTAHQNNFTTARDNYEPRSVHHTGA
ncbi:hypothetical protein M885DRAFT_578454 [Pelagophyceae sp. CCMP2097]|nr:hypothetical protein M885DRAFT_578454 [Pelagophyceae sp. CCMP2097]